MSTGLSAIAAAFAADPLGCLSLTRPQDEWVRKGSPEEPSSLPLLWLGANQIGKSYAQAAKLLHYLRASGPYAKRRPGPVNVTIVSISKEQIIPLMAKIWELLPRSVNEKGEEYCTEAPAARFEPGFGFRGKPPRIRFTRGPAKGSLVSFATYRQGSTRIAGATLDILMLDEPPPESLWGEVVLRMIRKGGQIWITMTITPESPPQEWLAKKVGRNEVEFMRTPTVDATGAANMAAFRPLDGSPPFLRRSVLLEAWRQTPEAERPLRFGAAWNGAVINRWLSAWSGACVNTERPPAGAKLIMGIDHSTTPGREIAVLVACQPGLPERPQDARFWVLDETEPGTPETMTSAHFAARVVAMLKRQGLDADHIDLWVGDRAAIQRTQRQAKADNAGLRRRIADALGVPHGRMARIEVPYKYSGTVSQGFQEMNTRMASGAWRVDPRCLRFIAAAENWDGDRASPHKDPLDATRYAMETALGGKNWHRAQAVRRLYT